MDKLIELGISIPTHGHLYLLGEGGGVLVETRNHPTELGAQFS